MTQQVINNGSAAGDGQGENLYTAFGKVNANFTELYALPSGGVPAGLTNYIQYNVSGAFAASIKYQWDDAANTMTLGTGLTGGIAYIKAGPPTSGAGNALYLQASNAVGTGAVAGGALSLLKTLQDAADQVQQEMRERDATIRRQAARLEELQRQPGPDAVSAQLLEHVAGVMVAFGRGDDTAQIRMELNDLLIRAGLVLTLDQDRQRIGYTLNGRGPEWVSYDQDAALVKMATGTIDPALFPSVMAEHRAVAADLLPLVEQAAQGRRAAVLAAGNDPARVNMAGQELTDYQAATGLAWLRSKMATVGSYDLAAEAQAVRDHVSRVKATRTAPED